MPLAACEAYGGIVAHDVDANLRQRFALGRVYFTRHDRRARLVFRQDQFAQPAARAGAQQADIIGDFEQAGRDGFQRAGDFHHRVMGGEGFELVGGGDEGQAGDLGHVMRDGLGPTLFSV